MHEALGFVPTTGSQHLSGRGRIIKFQFILNDIVSLRLPWIGYKRPVWKKEYKAIHKKNSDTEWNFLIWAHGHCGTRSGPLWWCPGKRFKVSYIRLKRRGWECLARWEKLDISDQWNWMGWEKGQRYEALTECLMYSFKDMGPIKDNNHLFN